MIGFVMLIVGLSFVFSRSALRKLTLKDFPGVDEGKFMEWQQASLKSQDLALRATWIALAITVAQTIYFGTRLFFTESLWATIVITLLWIAVLVKAIIEGGKAKKFGAAAGIKWPKR